MVPYLSTNTTFVRGQGDGFMDDYSRRRGYAYARRYGINPTGKIFVGSLVEPGRPPFAPEGWVDAGDAKDQIKRRLEKQGRGADGMVKVKPREREPINTGPYRPDSALVNDKVDEIVEREHGGKVAPKKRRDLFEATSEKLAGALGKA